jgi:hypothetical protein
MAIHGTELNHQEAYAQSASSREGSSKVDGGGVAAGLLRGVKVSFGNSGCSILDIPRE